MRGGRVRGGECKEQGERKESIGRQKEGLCV